MMTDNDGQNDVEQDWERRQKHASFFQTQLGSVQQAAIAAATFATVLLTVALALSKLSGLLPDQDMVIISLGVIAWLILSFKLIWPFSRSASRIRDAYLVEHALFFPSATPYRLESYLLDFGGRGAREPQRQV